ncbi:MAG TPA: zinc ribbon domain-containing protein [Thermodesulfobacteriota bacterium]|nr:zinc ribbon domain-containing protein [Thermodesulfobacteriota bacterium]HNU71425.1 zinc ribbon domain-containing protein [Thermodesulfobacteriota bacterium]HOC39442.1 zinc ribbon domain-containing protein [Thermodesulfobacteriota bacterium]HQO77390.1 zinc ribbon domain-containing protein [Thermodesulfobacteriota bacterium]
MPIYEYKCKHCGSICECMQKFSDAPLTDCKECGSVGAMEKMISLSSFHLKGSGWYVTDYGRKDTGGQKKKTTGAEKAASENKPSGSTGNNSGASE